MVVIPRHSRAYPHVPSPASSHHLYTRPGRCYSKCGPRIGGSLQSLLLVLGKISTEIDYKYFRNLSNNHFRFVASNNKKMRVCIFYVFLNLSFLYIFIVFLQKYWFMIKWKLKKKNNNQVFTTNSFEKHDFRPQLVNTRRSECIFRLRQS